MIPNFGIRNQHNSLRRLATTQQKHADTQPTGQGNRRWQTSPPVLADDEHLLVFIVNAKFGRNRRSIRLLPYGPLAE